jgi:MFS family permease
VYIPVVALYGYVISFTDTLIGVQSGPGQIGKLIVVVASIGAPLAASLIVGGRISDRVRMRRPFMALGLACFGGLAIVISFGQTVDALYPRWPLLVVLAAGAGTFPPAALAYLGDIVQHSVTGTTFGIYSIIFGSGLIVGPILGGALTRALGSIAFAVIALGLIGVSGAGLIFIREPSKALPAPVGGEASTPPARR